MFNAAEYVDEGERIEVVALEFQGCRFEGNVFPRKEGGFDLFLFRENSELECLEIEKITWLRHQAPDGLLFIERLVEGELSREVKRRMEATFSRWLEGALGLPIGNKYKCLWGA